MDEQLPDGTLLGVDWAVQHPQDYLDVFSSTIPEVMRMASVTLTRLPVSGLISLHAQCFRLNQTEPRYALWMSSEKDPMHG